MGVSRTKTIKKTENVGEARRKSGVKQEARVNMERQGAEKWRGELTRKQV
ncbi:hypothetical protein WN51_05898 [Melipona quadrifasciata]|uniref:Uncharacterized protein n=1 Tax=Melipona quadrifasciata TaxID=166423 RepID=A0A0M9A644_9HYME|nr:hypothetical protein WN51_05898 [Melipona quadrifasciata]